MKKALVFSGQGSHRKGMAMNLLTTAGSTTVWERMKSAMMQNFGMPLQEIIQENPNKVNLFDDALDIGAAMSHSCKEVRNTRESAPRNLTVANRNGVMQLTYFTQPCVLAAQMVTLERMKETAGLKVENYATIAGHSLGEFSALCALGVFSPETAVSLTFKRGMLMEKALENVSRDRHLMYACNPLRAKLHENAETANDYFFILVELVARALSHTSSFVEVANYNLVHEQYVVAGDLVALSVLGKCLDPQFRANSPHCDTLDGIVRDALTAVKLDKADGVTMQPNRPVPGDFTSTAFKKYGRRILFRRFARGPDDGATPALERLSHLTLEEDGRSGLKKKSWFVPLTVEIPFHTSLLRPCSDQFLSIVRDALPDEGRLRELLSVPRQSGEPQTRPLWVTNLTGGVFNPFDAIFQELTRDIISSLNVGEVQHGGRFSSDLLLDTFNNGVKDGCVADICSAVLAAQLSHSVLWIDEMDTIVLDEGCRGIDEIAPARNVSEMFKRTTFVDKADNGQMISLATKCFPADDGL